MRWLVVVALVAGCGSRCRDVAERMTALHAHRELAPAPHVEVRVPFVRANALVAELLRAEPIAEPISVPALGALGLPGHDLVATARDVQLARGTPGHVRVSARIELDDAERMIATFTIATEVAPRVVQGDATTAIEIGFGPENLVAVRPELSAQQRRTLAEAVARWLPDDVRARVPQALLDVAIGELAERVTSVLYELLQRTLLKRIGELTKLRVELPPLPIASSAIDTRDDTIVVAIGLDLPVRKNLAALARPSEDIALRVSGSAVAELANWAIARGYAPQRYTRSLEPNERGDYRPYFDYRADDRARPWKIHVVRERGGCEYFQIGVHAQLRVDGDKLEIVTRDQYVERAHAGALLELGLALKQLAQGSVGHSRRALAHVRVDLGAHAFHTRLVRAAIEDDEVELELALAVTSARR